MNNFIEGIGEFFPCKHCAAHFKMDIEQSIILIFIIRSSQNKE